MTKLSLLAALSCVLASVAALPAPGSGGVNVGQRISLLPRAEEAEDPNKIDQTAQFNTKVALTGGNIQQDTTFPPGVSASPPPWSTLRPDISHPRYPYGAHKNADSNTN